MKLCTIENCSNSFYAKQLCKSHYLKNYRITIGTKLLGIKYYSNRRFKQKENKKIYRKTHRKQLNAIEAEHRIAKLRRTPKWVDLKVIEEIYLKCPKNHHVDHIIPLKGKNVSGLHVPWNLQYLTKSENSSKNNKFDGTFENSSWRTLHEPTNI